MRRPIEELVAMLHEFSVNAVVIAARHTFFDRVEKAIRACELEGIETWLLADFFETQISETSLDHFYGRPSAGVSLRDGEPPGRG
jgi:spore maturation protein CgeB